MFSVQDAAVREGEEPALIAAVPGRAGGVREPPLDVAEDEGDHDGYTLVMDAVATVPPAGTGDAAGSGPGVLAVVCGHGHANPPHRHACTLCGGEIVGEPRRVPRPSLGRLVLPNGDHLELDAPVVVGRNPRADRVQGPVLPQLVPIAQGHVSGNHLEIRLEEWSVLAVDLHSTNGTLLRRHGEPSVRLGERPEVLIEGDVLDLGHGVQFTLEHLR